MSDAIIIFKAVEVWRYSRYARLCARCLEKEEEKETRFKQGSTGGFRCAAFTGLTKAGD